MIFYSNVNEDNFVERRLLNSRSFRDLYCIAGSGERLMSLLDNQSIKRVYVIDQNEKALFLIQLKLTALKNLTVRKYLEFIGVHETQYNRISLFGSFEEELPLECRAYWRDNLDLIQNGILNSGHFEKFLSRIRPLLKSFLGKKFYDCFQKTLNDNHSFPSKRWSLIRFVFSKRQAYLIAGSKDLSFIAKDADQNIIPKALHKTLKEGKVSQNCMFHLVFKGHFEEMSKDFIPPSLDVKVLEDVKKTLEEKELEMSFHPSDILDFCNRHQFDANSKSFFSLSDILSFNEVDYIKRIFRLINNHTQTGSMLVFRAFLRNRFKPNQLAQLRSEYNFVKDLSDQENTGMYQVILLEP